MGLFWIKEKIECLAYKLLMAQLNGINQKFLSVFPLTLVPFYIYGQ